MLRRERKTIDNTCQLTTQSTAFYFNQADLKKRHELALPPDEAYSYKPKGNEVILVNEKKPCKSIRRIYFDVEYNQFEKDLLKKFKQLLKDWTKKNGKTKPIEFPEGWSDEDNLRYIYSTNCHLTKALTDMIEHFEWRNASFPMQISNKVIEVLNLGFLYILGRDYQFRPIIVCNANVYVKHQSEYIYEEWLSATLFLSQYMCTYLLIPGHIENSIMITNVQGVQLFFMPPSMKKLIKLMSDQFRSRLYLNFIVGLSPAMRFLYKLVCKFLDECTVKKLIIVDQVKDGKLQSQISPENLEERFGGKVTNVRIGKDSLFPPFMPLCNHPKDNARESQIVIDNEEDEDKVSPLKPSRQSLIQSRFSNKREEEAFLRRSALLNEFEEEPIKTELVAPEDSVRFKSPSSLIDYLNEFNHRKQILNFSFLAEGHKPSDDNKNVTVSIEELSTNTFHK